MKMRKFVVLNDEEMQRIDSVSVDILENTGVHVESERAMEVFHGAGAHVNRKSGIVTIPQSLVRDALKKTPSRIKLYDRELKHCYEIGGGLGIAAPGHNAVKIIDHVSGEHRDAVCSDCADFARLVDAIDDYETIAVPMMPQDVHPKSTILHGFIHTASNTTKHVYFSPDSVDATVGVIELSRMLCGRKDLSKGSPITCQLSPTSPLVWDREAVEGVMACAEAGIPLSFLPQPFSGMTAPITTAGLLAQHNAEFLSGLVLSHAVRPGTPIIYGTAWTTFDMKKANIILCSPETAALRVAGVQLAEYYDMPSHTIGPDADAHFYDEQLGWEKLLSTISAMGAGVDLIVNAGLFDSAWTVSLEQVVLDAEILSICRRFLHGIPVDDTTLALDTIRQVGPGGHFMESPHTLEQLRAGALWEATVSNTFTSKQWEERGKPSVQSNAAARVDALLSSHTPKAPGSGIVQDMREMVEQFEKSHSTE
jgi:trimethylamine--corrinoid protein Co-methyltransferase